MDLCSLIENGAVTAIRQKRELPNYGTFDEKRLFVPGPLPEPITFRGVKIGVLTCDVAASSGMILGSNKELDCSFKPNHGKADHYSGSIGRIGPDDRRARTG